MAGDFFMTSATGAEAKRGAKEYQISNKEFRILKYNGVGGEITTDQLTNHPLSPYFCFSWFFGGLLKLLN